MLQNYQKKNKKIELNPNREYIQQRKKKKNTPKVVNLSLNTSHYKHDTVYWYGIYILFYIF